MFCVSDPTDQNRKNIGYHTKFKPQHMVTYVVTITTSLDAVSGANAWCPSLQYVIESESRYGDCGSLIFNKFYGDSLVK